MVGSVVPLSREELRTLGRVAPLCPSFSSVAANDPNYARPPIQLDPSKPITSLSSGGQQFTILSDTDHGVPMIEERVARELRENRNSGIKHIMVEYDIPSPADIERKYPEIGVAQTADQKIKILEDGLSRIETRRDEIAAGLALEHPNWSAERVKEFTDLRMQHESQDLNMSIQGLKIHDMRDRLYANPPRITADELIEAAPLLASGSVKDDNAALQSGLDHVEMMVTARRQGIQVHFTGDTQSVDRLQRIEELELMRTWEIADRTKMVADYAAGQGSSSTASGDQAASSADRELKHLQDLGASYKRENAILEESLGLKTDIVQERLDPALEAQRADRFVRLAGGEKALIIWGAGHSNKPNDFNEMLDDRLRQEALKQGTLDRLQPTRVIEMYESEAAYNDYLQNRGKPADEPDAVYLAKEGKVLITESGADGLCVKTDKAPASSAPSVSVPVVQ